MNLLEIIDPSCIKVPLSAGDKKGAIDELVDLLAAAGRVKDPAALKAAVWARETTRTTGIGYSLAIPHGKSDGVPRVCIAIGKPAQPIDFASIDGKPVRLVVLIASPPDKTSDHIQVLARISRLMTPEDFRERIYAATSAQEAYEIFKAHEPAAPRAGA